MNIIFIALMCKGLGAKNKVISTKPSSIILLLLLLMLLLLLLLLLKQR